MTFPTVAVVTTNLDAGTDSPASARSDLLDAVQKLNQMIAHVSAFAATLMDDADAATARTTIGLGTGSSPTFAGLTSTGQLNVGLFRALGEFTYITGYSGAWATGYAFKGSAGTDRGGFGAFGTNDTLTNFWIGPSYSSPWMTIASTGAAVTGAITATGTVSGATILTNTAAVSGYTTGAGGTVTQLTNKTTAVTINTPTGKIITSNASMGANSYVYFAVNNSTVSASDVIILNLQSAASASSIYTISVRQITSGQFTIEISQLSSIGAPFSDALQINFVVIKGATS